ncbi:MAG: type I polyketide synthase [Pseudomonadota bacterium]
MSDDFLDRISKLSPKRLALLALEQHEQLQAAREPQAPEPIAVVGLGCRFPGGADDGEAFWALLREGRDAIREVPAERWNIDDYFDPDPDAPAKMSVRHGGFLDRVDGFDAAFFGVSPREALTMDPQQRLMLEVAWEALEHAGLSPERLAGTPTGVFLGVCNSDHFQRVLGRGVEEIDAYLASGNAHSVASGRVAYFLGLQGPALSIDTACSSSLVALHVACQSLRSGETRVALAGGVNVMCAPETTVALTKAHMLAPDGRCKTFDASADGFARGEGCGVLVLKRLADAQADGDRILAVVRGSATNQDGRSGGLTVPNGPAQEAVIRAALADARLQPGDIDYVEAHGTGTTLGDPIEVRALGNALAAGRAPEQPLLIGSVKTNFGHLESAAGIAGVIKVVLALQHERIPPHLHFRQPSPHIAWDAHPVRVAPEGVAWPRGARVRRAGVSSFGFSGTNAHVIVEEAPPAEARPAAPARPVHCLPLSARSDAALRTLAQRHAAALQADAPWSLADAAHTAGVGRAHFAERLAVVAADKAEAAAALAAFARGETPPALQRGSVVPGQPAEVVFLFTGQGSQYPGMAQALYERSPVFREVIDRCDALLGPDEQGRTLKAVLQPGPADNAPVHETAWTQPALFAVEYGLAMLWRSWGVEPAAVIGHSVGEYVAACVAGVFSLEDGLQLIRERGRLMQALPPGGAMAAVFASAELVQAEIGGDADRLAIAAVNAHDSVVVSGDEQRLQALLERLAARNIQGHKLFISLAAHSPLVAPALDAMQACAARVGMQAPRIPVAWNLTGGEPLPGGAPDAAYWRRHLREAVRFADGVQSLHRQGYRLFLEVGPHPTLTALAQRSLPEQGTSFVASLRRGKDDWQELMQGLAALYVHGAAIDWTGVDRPHAPARVALPGYPFERRSFWIAPATPGARPAKPARAAAAPLPGRRLDTAVPIFETLLAPDRPAGLGDHRIQGAVLVAAPVMLAMAQQAARELAGHARRAVEAFSVLEPLVLPEAGRTVQVQLNAQADGALQFAVHSRADDGGGAWTQHAGGVLRESAATLAELALPPEEAFGPAAGAEAYYQRLAGLGIDLRGAFRGLAAARQRDGEVLAELALPAGAGGFEALQWAHPGLVDAALQAVGLAVPAAAGGDELHLLTQVDRLDLIGPLPERLRCHVRLQPPAGAHPAQWRADATLFSEDGRALGRIEGITLRRASRDALARAVGGAAVAGEDLFYRVDWEPAPIAPRAAPRLQGPTRFEAPLRERFAALAAEHAVEVYETLLPALDRLSAGHVAKALRRLGFDATPGRRFAADEEARRLRIAERHQRLFGRLLQMLEEDGVLRREGSAFQVIGALPPDHQPADDEAVARRHGEVDGELSTLRRCGPELARVLTGEQDPLQLLFPGGSFAEARRLYVESPYARTYNAALAEALRAALAEVPAESRLRVLEVGAGTGGTTTYALPALQGRCRDYVFTDLSPLFLERAKEQFGADPALRTALLDIERDPLTQGFVADAYDLTIAANVVHATQDLRQSLRHIRQLLAPGGMLLLLEGVAPERWVDLTFGLTDGWWRFVDTDLRPDYPLIGHEAWRRALSDAGFSEVSIVPSDTRGRGLGQQALIMARAPRRARRVALVGGEPVLVKHLSERLTERGDTVRHCPADAPAETAADEWVYLGATELGADDTAQRTRALSTVLPLQWCAGQARSDDSGRAWFVTRGAQPAGGRPAAGSRVQAPLWGVGRVFSLEQPHRFGALVDLDASQPVPAQAEQLLAQLDAADGEDQVAFRGAQRFAARLDHAAPPQQPAVRLRADATYLVTGGFGGLGLLVGRWLAEQGARHVALLGRHPDLQAEGVQALRAAGAQVWPLQADVADEASLKAALDGLAASAPPLRGVMHAAAALSSAPITELTEADVQAMLGPKVDGTLLLEKLTRGLPLDFVVLFSSSTALLGAAGLAHYAAANLFLDATAQAAPRPGPQVLSVNWGTWEAMRLASADSQRGFRASGLVPMPAGEALQALGRLLAADTPQAMVARIDWATLKPLHESRRARPFLRRLGVSAPAPAASPAAKRDDTPALAQQLAQVAPGARQEVLTAFVQREVAAVLGWAPHEPVPTATGLFDLGMDSLMSVELKRRLERGAGRTLPSTLTFNYPNVNALAGFLATLFAAPEAPVAAPVAAPEPAPVQGADLDALSDDELEARLLAKLEQI